VTKATILIVEDDAIISIRLQEMLASWGYRTLSASSGEQALKEIGQSLPDLVLLDVRLKGALDGIEVAEKILGDYKMPTIFLSAYADEELLRRARLTEPYGYLVKPVHERELISIVEMALYKHSMDHRLRESEEKFRALADTSSAAILILQDNHCVYANPAAEIISGYPLEEFLAIDPNNRMDPTDQPLVNSWLNSGLEGWHENMQRSFSIRTGQGEIRWVEIAVTGMIYMGKKAVVVTANDITDRKNAEQALHESRAQLQDLARYLQTVREDERSKIAHEIHDEFGQALTVIKMDLHLIAEQYKHDLRLRKQLSDVMSLTDSAIDMVRRVASELRPGILDDLGLEATLEWQSEDFCDHTHIACNFRWELGDQELGQRISTTLFRIYQESLTNVVRHSGATQVDSSLKIEGDWLVLTIEDNGRGITLNEICSNQSMGLLGMRERARALGGDVDFQGKDESGTSVRARFPLMEVDYVTRKNFDY